MKQQKSRLYKKIESILNSCINCQRYHQARTQSDGSGVALPVLRCKKCQEGLDKIFDSGYTAYMKHFKGQM
jgi:DNA polymerase III alpha subunit (gram-positive type)